MDKDIPIDIALYQYYEILKIKPKELQTKYPFSAMDDEDVAKTLKRIELVYQNLTPGVSAFILDDESKSGKTKKWKTKMGGGSPITIFTL